MWLRVDPRASTPVYRQIVDAIKEDVARGVLLTGDRLPSVRDLAVDLTLNHNTVARAYQELEREQVIDVLRGRGAFVAAVRTDRPGPERLEAVEGLIRRLLVEAHHLQLGDDELLAKVRAGLGEFRREKGGDRS